jgi:hypothetical protein
MTNFESTKSQQDKDNIEKIKCIRDLLTSSVPADDQAGFGEYTKYVPVFNQSDRESLTKKAMELIKKL